MQLAHQKEHEEQMRRIDVRCFFCRLDWSVKPLFCFVPWNAEVAPDAIKRTFGTPATCPSVWN